jgi:hypothetical protein
MHGRNTVALLVVISLCGTSSARDAAANCDAELVSGRAIAGELSISVEVPAGLRIGEPVKITWRNVSNEHLLTPIYFMVTAPAEVRFSGTGFMAFAAKAKGPHGLRYGRDGARAFVPLHRATGAAKRGDISVIPYRRGVQTIAWAVATVGTCGEHVFGSGEKTIDVAPGAAEIVVQDRFADEKPLKRIRSPGGVNEALDFGTRYQVREVATGAKVVERSGVGPIFSPTGRFVVSRRAKGGELEIFDLVARKLLPSHGSGEMFLMWIRNDSYVIFGWEFYSSFTLTSTLVDNSKDLNGGLGNCRLCKPWDVRLVLNLEDGFVAEAKGDMSPGRANTGVDDADVEDIVDFEREPSDLADPRLRSARDYARTTFNSGIYIRNVVSDRSFQIWDLGEPVMFSHTDSAVPRGFGHILKPQTADTSNKPVLTLGELRGRPLTGRGALTSRPNSLRPVPTESEAFARLASFGLGTRRPLPIDTETANPTSATYPPWITQAINNMSNTSSEGGCFARDVFRWHAATGNRWLLSEICEFGRLEDAQTTVSFDLLNERTLQKSRLKIGWRFTALVGSEVLPEIPIRVYRISERLVAVASLIDAKVALFDCDTGETVTSFDLVDSLLLSEMRLTDAGSHIIQINGDGRFFVYRVVDGMRVLNGAYVDDEIVVATDAGLYDATYEGAQAVQVRFPGSPGLFRFNQFEAALRRPGLAAAVLAGKPFSPPPPAISVPPTAELILAEAAADGRRKGKVIATSDRELEAVRIYVDGRFVQQIVAKGTQQTLPIDLAEPGGARWISAVAIDTQGLVSQPSAIQLPGKPISRGIMRAVLVAFDAYKDQALPHLTYAASDARRLERALQANRGRAVQAVRTTELLDPEVTPGRILATVREAAQATKPDDMLIIFYAGHGIEGRTRGQTNAGLVLTTPNTNLANLETTALAWTSLSDALAGAQGTIIVLLDACHAGLAASDAFATNEDAVSALITRAGSPMVVLAGSKGRQLSNESKEVGGGLFTAAVAAVIDEERAKHDRGSGGLIDLGELYSAVKTRVVKATNGSQTPWLVRNSLVGEMALF